MTTPFWWYLCRKTQGRWVLSHLRPAWSESYWRAVLETEMETEVVMDLDWYLASFLICSFLLVSLLKMYPGKYFVRSSQCQGLYLGESKLCFVFFFFFSIYSISASSKLCLFVWESNFCSRLSHSPCLKITFTENAFCWCFDLFLIPRWKSRRNQLFHWQIFPQGSDHSPWVVRISLISSFLWCRWGKGLSSLLAL